MRPRKTKKGKTMDKTRKSRLEEHLLLKHSKVMVNRLFRLAEGWASFEAFLQASKGDLLKRWRELNPGSDRDLGDEFYATMDDAAAWCASPASEARPSEAPDPVFTKDQLKKVLDFLEMFDKADIRLSEIQSLLAMTHRKEA